MLPAMSTVSTRDELRALAHHLGSRRCIITDWPGFGDTARPRLDYDRALCRGFLEELVTHLQRRARAELVPGGRLRPCGRLRDRPRGAAPWDLHAPRPDRADLAWPASDHDEWAKAHPGTHPEIDPRPGHRRAALPAERLAARRTDDVPKTRVRRSRVLDRRPAGRSHASDPPARRPLCFRLLRHRRPRPVRRPRRLPRRGPTRSSARC